MLSLDLFAQIQIIGFKIINIFLRYISQEMQHQPVMGSVVALVTIPG